MKNRVIMCSIVSIMGVVSFLPSIAAKAGNYVSSCYRCGGDSTAYTVVSTRDERTGETRTCGHGYGGIDFQVAFYERVNYYCPDYNVNWEQDEFAGLAWECQH